MAQQEAPKIDLLNKYPILIGIVDRCALSASMFLVGKGVISASNQAGAHDFIQLGIGLLLAALVGWYQNRPVALAQAATTISPDTQVVTTPEVAKATPDNKNIVPNDEKKVVKK